MSERIIRVKHQEKRNVYIHNDLENAAHHFGERIKARLAADNRDGIMFDCMACATMLAFTWEAYLNFFGHKLVGNWNEKANVYKKIDKVFQRLKIAPKWAERPYSSIRDLKEVRNILAHGKPVEEEIEKYEEAPQGKVERRRIDLSGKWDCESRSGHCYRPIWMPRNLSRSRRRSR